MFKPADPRRLSRARTWLMLLVLPASALAGLLPPGEVRGLPDAPPAAYEERGPLRYRMRCWQYGQLLFEEHLSALPNGNARRSIRLSGTDLRGRPVHVAEVDGATCLIDSLRAGRELPR